MEIQAPNNSTAQSPSSVFEVLKAATRLGLTSFGGPVAHIGYFREEYVVRRKWVDESTYADLVALCQFLPGPASSQVGIALGIIRAGLPGASRPGSVSPSRPPCCSSRLLTVSSLLAIAISPGYTDSRLWLSRWSRRPFGGWHARWLLTENAQR